MATGYEVFGSCVGEINVSVGNENRGEVTGFAVGWKYLGFILAG